MRRLDGQPLAGDGECHLKGFNMYTVRRPQWLLNSLLTFWDGQQHMTSMPKRRPDKPHSQPFQLLTLASSERKLIWQAEMMPIHIHRAPVAQGKYFPKLSINRKTIFEQLRGETDWVRRKERNQRGDLNPLCIHAIHIHKVAAPYGETGDALRGERRAVRCKGTFLEWTTTVVEVDFWCLDWRKLGDIEFNKEAESGWAQSLSFVITHCTFSRNTVDGGSREEDLIPSDHFWRFWKE